MPWLHVKGYITLGKLSMLKRIKALFLFGLFFTPLTFAQAKNIQLEYEVSRNGSAFATVTESYKQEGDQYRIVSTTKGDGIYALLGERVLTSEGSVTSSGLKPMHFEFTRGDDAKKSLSSTFDWASNRLDMVVKGETKTATLTPDAQDLASYPYQFMFAPPKGKQIVVMLTTGKKFKPYQYNINSQHTIIKVGNKEYETVHIVDAESNGKEKKELWLAKSLQYLPVKYLVVDKHGDALVQTLVKASIQ